MAATQAQKPQNDVNSEKVQSDQHLNLRNTLLQNGTEKSGVRSGSGGSVVVTKTKASSTSAKNQNLCNIEMSQYRQDGVSGSCPVSQSVSEKNSSGTSVDSDHNQNADDTYTPVSDSAIGSDTSSPIHGYGFSFGGGGRTGSGSFSQHSSSGVDQQQHNSTQQHQQQNNTDGNILQSFGQFGSQPIRHGFSGSKQPMIGPRTTSTPIAGQIAFHQQQRFISGQSISQPTGPTPTLNQLLQSSNPMHRYQNSYGHGDQGPYTQSWSTQKTISSYSPQGLISSSATPLPAYRNQIGLPSAYSGVSSPSSPGSYEQQQIPAHAQHTSSRQCWNNQNSQTQHHPPSPGGTAASRLSPQPGSHSPGPGMPTSPQQQTHQPPPSSVPSAQPATQTQSFPSRPVPSTTPSAHAPDAGDLTGQNSNDSSNGPAPGTPNSQGMRPTPSPTGSTGSRSMSPAVGQQNIPIPPRPSSSQSDGSGPTRLSHSPMATQSGYQHLGPPPHIGHSGYKLSGHSGMVSASGQQISLYNTSTQQYQLTGNGNYTASTGSSGNRSQGNIQYPGPSQNYPSPSVSASQQQSTVANNLSLCGSNNNNQYTSRPILNHIPHSQYPAYQQSWSNNGPTVCPSSGKGTGVSVGGVSGLSSAVQNSGNVGPQSTNTVSTNVSSSRSPHYLKQHLQQKISFGSSVSSSISGNSNTLQVYSSSGGGSPALGSAVHQHVNNLSMGPPLGTSPGHHQGMGPPATMGPPNMVPPTSTSISVPTSTPPLLQQLSSNHDGPPIMPPPSSTPNSHSVHSLSLTHSSCDTGSSDVLESSITTTASGNMITIVTSVACGSVTSVVTTGPDGTTLDEGSQQSTLSNTSAASGEDHQCSTPKTRKNEITSGHYSHPTTPQSTVPSPGAASMNSLHEEYDISSPSWPRTPASPKTDSLGKLYEMDDSPDRRNWLDKLLAFMEERRTPITTCPTISKNPLDLFRLYMYVKERGGFMEVTKNKTWKDIAGMLGIGASSSAAYTLRKHYTKNLLAYECQFDRGGIDPQPIINQVEASSKKKSAKAASVPSPGSSNSQDSFPAPSSSGTSLDSYGGYGYPPGTTPDYNSSPMQRPSSQTNAPSPHTGIQQVYTTQSGYSQYPGPGPGTSPDQFQSYPPNSGYSAATRTVYPQYSGSEGDRNYNQSSSSNTSSVNVPPITQSNNQGVTASQPSPYPSQQDYYRPEQPQGPLPPVSGSSGQVYPNGSGNKNMPPPAPQPRRHPDFAKEQQTYPPYGQQRPQLYGWPATNSSNYRGQYQTPNIGPSSPQQWNQLGSRATGPHNNQNGNSQWEQRYSVSGQQSYQGSLVQQGQQWSPIPTPGIGQSSPLRTPLGPRTSFRADGKSLNMLSPQGIKNTQTTSMSTNSFPQQPLPKREISFPSDSVEATIPVLYRRKRVCKLDMGSVDAWKIMMSLRSGLLSETTYALDALNILLFDDTTVSYFGLSQWPGMLDLLLEHFRKSLSDMFDVTALCEPNSDWYQSERSESCDVDLGAAQEICVDEHEVILTKTPNYTQISRRQNPVKILEKHEDIFICDSHKNWDVDGDAAGINIADTIDSDAWLLGNINPTCVKYILPCFQSEFNSTHYFQHLINDTPSENKGTSIETQSNVCNFSDTYELSDSKNLSLMEEEKCLDFKKHSFKNCNPKRTQNLYDVISHIKKESTEINDLMELKEKIKTEPDFRDENSTLQDEDECTEESRNSEDQTRLHIKDIARTLKRRRMSDYEDECYTRDEASLCLVTDSQDAVAKRCVCISNILRNLTFIPGNEIEFAKNTTFLSLLGKLLLLHHDHPVRTHKTKNYDREEDADFVDSCSSLHGESEWWWDFLIQIRENVLVSCANISGHIDLSQYDEIIARPVLDGLLHWAVCPSAHGQDPFVNVGQTSLLSPQRLALESLCKLCVTDSNVDLVIATPPFSRLERLCSVLTKHLCRSEDQVLREFSVNLLHYLAAADSSMARVVAMQSPCVSLLVAFIEQAEQSALGVANQHGIGALRENPDSMGTSLDMLRRAAGTLLHLAKHPDNRPLFLQQEQRLLQLVMSQILDQQVAFVIARVLFHISRTNENSSKSDNS